MQRNQDCYIVEASAGQSVIIPGDYEHITINPSPNQQMKMANWISLDYSSDYSTINDKQGACWFYTTEGWKRESKLRNSSLNKERTSFGQHP